MNQKTLGIVSAPGLAEAKSRNLKDILQESLEKEIPGETEWTVEVQVDRIVGSATLLKHIMDQTNRLKETNNWDGAIAVTDLPVFHKKSAVLSDINIDQEVAQISLPAFGSMPTTKNLKNTIIHIVKELTYRHMDEKENVRFVHKGIGIQETHKDEKRFEKLAKVFHFTAIQRHELDKPSGGVSVRFLLRPKINGKLKILFGMMMLNRPWSIIPSFKKVIGLAFATGSYMIIFNTLWQMSAVYETPRFIALMLLAMFAMVVWIIFAHNLWEKKSDNYGSDELYKMYNLATILTLSFSVILFYIAMFILFLFAVGVFVPDKTFEDVVQQNIHFKDYVKLAWLVSSAATVAGAIGAGLENEDEVKRNAYGYRQYTRSKEIEAMKKEETEEERVKEEEEKKQEKE